MDWSLKSWPGGCEPCSSETGGVSFPSGIYAESSNEGSGGGARFLPRREGSASANLSPLLKSHRFKSTVAPRPLDSEAMVSFSL